jgi:predicted secreted protein
MVHSALSISITYVVVISRTAMGVKKETILDVGTLWSTVIQKVFFTLHHVGRWCLNEIPRALLRIRSFLH